MLPNLRLTCFHSLAMSTHNNPTDERGVYTLQLHRTNFGTESSSSQILRQSRSSTFGNHKILTSLLSVKHVE